MGKDLFVTDGNDITIRVLTLTRARVPDGNGAGIRAEGGDLTVQNVHSPTTQDACLPRMWQENHHQRQQVQGPSSDWGMMISQFSGESPDEQNATNAMVATRCRCPAPGSLSGLQRHARYRFRTEIPARQRYISATATAA
jgi:hypothetical protein